MITHLIPSPVVWQQSQIQVTRGFWVANFNLVNDVILTHNEAISFISFHISFDNSPTWGATQAAVSELSLFFFNARCLNVWLFPKFLTLE